MASNLIAMASKLLAMSSNLKAMVLSKAIPAICHFSLLRQIGLFMSLHITSTMLSIKVAYSTPQGRKRPLKRLVLRDYIVYGPDRLVSPYGETGGVLGGRKTVQANQVMVEATAIRCRPSLVGMF